MLTLHDFAGLVLGRVGAIAVDDIVVVPGVDRGDERESLGVGARGEMLHIVLKVVLLDRIPLLVVEFERDTFIAVHLKPFDHLGHLEHIVVVDLVSASNHGVEGLLIMGRQQIVPKRVGAMEITLGICNIGGEAVAGVEGPVVALLQRGDVKVPLLGLGHLLTILLLKPVLDLLLAMGHQLQLDIVTVKTVALPVVELSWV